MCMYVYVCVCVCVCVWHGIDTACDLVTHDVPIHVLCVVRRSMHTTRKKNAQVDMWLMNDTELSAYMKQKCVSLCTRVPPM